MKTLNYLSLVISALLILTLAGCEAESVIPLLQSSKDRSIHVTGSGSVTGEPDIATLNFGVSVEKETVAEAREAAAVAMTAVLDSLKANDIAEEDIQTENFSIRPQYDYTENGRVLRGYRVNNIISAKVRELQRLSDIIDDAAGAGGDIIVVNSIQFMIEDPTALQTEARALAAKDAEAKAQTLADAHGVKLGKPVNITEVTSGGISPIVFAESVAAADSLRASTPIEAGQLTVTVNITVVYEFE
ncbi:MAG: SIMPL domain-containing protein [Candidatus Poribacteria bacterium]|nr:SIMPL domain-containing protein [Candidatus Poribacteria bacterium]MDE0506542.1 SIMPL domain-containing protein [Candidatus Poribacteria bacterium]